MKKLNETIYNKLLAQAEEAKEQGKVKLASDIFGCIGSYAENEETEYSSAQLESDLKAELWRAASNIMNYHGIESIDAEKLDLALTICAEKLLNEVETALNVEPGRLGPLEPKVFGEQ